MNTATSVRLGICQMITVDDKQANIETARQYITEAVNRGAEIIVLPEMFNCPYDKEFFKKYSENVSSDEKPTIDFLSSIAKQTQRWIVGGSIPEIDDHGKVYNTSFVFNKDGKIAARHRKVHLFDIDVTGQFYKESETLSAGNHATVFETEFCKIGLAICYDMRFPELAIMMRDQGAQIMIYPAAFNATTGPMHFELLGKARALDNQCFVVLAAPARDLTKKTGYMVWGHSAVISPNGFTLAQAELPEKLLIVDLDLKDVERQRAGFPFDKQRRSDMYEMEVKNLH